MLLDAVVVGDDDVENTEEEVVEGVEVAGPTWFAGVVVDKLSDDPLQLLLLLLSFVVVVLLLIRSEMIALLFTSQLLGEVGGEVEVGEAEAELELATELQLPVFLDKSVGSFSLAAAEA